MIHDKEEAQKAVEETERPFWEQYLHEHPELGTSLGASKILGEHIVQSHKVWEYFIEGMPAPLDGRKYYITDTKQLFETSIDEDSNTIEKAYIKMFKDQGYNVPH